MGATPFLERLWPDMCAAYRDADLARACLAVQEEYDVDVPLLLVLCLADRAGHRIGREDLVVLIEESRAWREAAILPLRFARQAMKDRFTAPAEHDLRDAIKHLELEAERLHVQRLAEAFPPARKNAQGAAPIYLAMRGASSAAAGQFVKTLNQACDAQIPRAAARPKESQDHE